MVKKLKVTWRHVCELCPNRPTFIRESDANKHYLLSHVMDNLKPDGRHLYWSCLGCETGFEFHSGRVATIKNCFTSGDEIKKHYLQKHCSMESHEK